jgi:hypothetical protein
VKAFSLISGLEQRPLAAVPRSILAVFALALALQIGLRAFEPPPPAEAADLPSPPSMPMLRLASLGEPEALAKLLMLYLQAFDYQTAKRVPYQKLDYDVIIAWLDRMLTLDPAAQYPLNAASRLYAEIPDPVKQRKMLDFIYREFLVDPDHRWPWLAHAALIAKHEQHDLPLALRYASAIGELSNGPDVPAWARTMRVFLLEDMNQLEQVKVLLGALLVSGNIRDPAEKRFLQQKLDEMEKQTPKPK